MQVWCLKLLFDVQAVAIPGNYVFDTVTIVSLILSFTLPIAVFLWLFML